MSTILSGARQLTCPVFGILLRAVFSGLLPKALRLNFNNERMMNQAINSSHRHCRVRKDRIPSTEGVISRTAEFIVTSLHPAIWKSLLFCLSVIPICYLSLMLFWKCQKLRLSPAPPALMSRLKWRLKLTWCTANGDILDSWILVIVFPMRWQRRGMNPCYSKETISPKLILIEQVFHKFHKFYGVPT